MDVQALIAKRLAAPKNFRVTVKYDDGSERTIDTETAGQADTMASYERVKIGRDLIDRETGETVRVVSVTITTL